jgi:hypothetical protein
MFLNLWGTVKKSGTWFTAGFVDRISSRISNKEISFSKKVAEKIAPCEPWTDHFHPHTLENLDKAIKYRQFATAKFLLEIGRKEDAKGYCVQLASTLIDWLAQGAELQISLYID